MRIRKIDRERECRAQHAELFFGSSEAFGDGVSVGTHEAADAELDAVRAICEAKGADFALSEVFAKGGDGGVALAEKVVAACEKQKDFKLLYADDLSITEKIETIAKELYGAAGVVFEAGAKKALADILAIDENYAKFPVCMAKTQYSLSDNQALLGRPTGFTLTVRDIRLSAGAGFIVALTGSIMTMPGLGKTPTAYSIDIDNDGNISGLF